MYRFIRMYIILINLILLNYNCCLLIIEVLFCYFKDDVLIIGKMLVKYLLFKKVDIY